MLLSLFSPLISIFSTFFLSTNKEIKFLCNTFTKHAKHILYCLKTAGSVLFNWVWFSPSQVLRERQASS